MSNNVENERRRREHQIFFGVPFDVWIMEIAYVTALFLATKSLLVLLFLVPLHAIALRLEFPAGKDPRRWMVSRYKRLCVGLVLALFAVSLFMMVHQ